MIEDQGRQFALLDWDLSQPRGSTVQPPTPTPMPMDGGPRFGLMEGEEEFEDLAEEDPMLNEDDELLKPDEKGFVERSKAMKWDG